MNIKFYWKTIDILQSVTFIKKLIMFKIWNKSITSKDSFDWQENFKINYNIIFSNSN